MGDQQHKKTIGILGGMGPLASANLYYDIINAAQKLYGAEQDTDFPPMFIYNLPVDGFDEAGSLDPFVHKQLLKGVKKLEEAGSDFIIIACNTVHYFYKDMQDAVKIPILNIIEETVQAVAQENYNTVGLLTSESTKKSKLYQEAFNKAGLKALPVTDQEQEILNRIVLNVMGGNQGEADKEKIKNISKRLLQQGAQSIVLGCTELPLAIDQKDSDIKMFATTEIIAESALRKAIM